MSKAKPKPPKSVKKTATEATPAVGAKPNLKKRVVQPAYTKGLKKGRLTLAMARKAVLAVMKKRADAAKAED